MTKKTLVTNASISVFSKLRKFLMSGTNSLNESSTMLVSKLVVFFNSDVHRYCRTA